MAFSSTAKQIPSSFRKYCSSSLFKTTYRPPATSNCPQNLPLSHFNPHLTSPHQEKKTFKIKSKNSSRFLSHEHVLNLLFLSAAPIKHKEKIHENLQYR